MEMLAFFGFIAFMALIIAGSWYLKKSKLPASNPAPSPKPEPKPVPPGYRLQATRLTTAPEGLEPDRNKPPGEPVSWVQDHGLRIFYQDGDVLKPTVKFSVCDLWLANVCTAFFKDLELIGVTAVHHFGIYNFRKVSGSANLSKHAFALAIDISGFQMSSGQTISLLKDWDAGDVKAETLRTIRKIAGRHFHAVLDPAFNAAHKDHFHCELTPSKRPPSYPYSPSWKDLPTRSFNLLADDFDVEECKAGHDCAEHEYTA